MTLPPFHWWRTVFWLIPVIGLATIGLGVLSMAASALGRQNFAHRCARGWSRVILGTSGVRLDLRGEPLPDASESCIYVANHASFFDIPIVFVGVPRQLRIMAKAALGRIPFIGWHLRWAGHLLVDRTKPGAAIFKRMQRLVRGHASLIVFPEGGRSGDGRVGPFKAGVFLLAIETGVPIVPITVDGARLVMPRGRLMVCPATVRLTVHPAISTRGLSREDARGLAERVRQIVQQPMA